MADPSALTPVAPVAQTASGASASADIGAHRGAAKLILEVSAAAGTTPSITVAVQTSPSGVTWATVGPFTAMTATGFQDLVVSELKRYVRFSWTITGTLPSFTFTIGGTAYQVYAQVADIQALGLPVAALAGTDAQVLARTVIAVTDKVAGYLKKGNALPGTTWSEDVRRCTAIIAAYDLLVLRGFNPDEYDENFRQRYLDELKWLESIAAGDLDPTDDDDDGDGSSIAVGRARASSLLRRGW